MTLCRRSADATEEYELSEVRLGGNGMSAAQLNEKNAKAAEKGTLRLMSES